LAKFDIKHWHFWKFSLGYFLFSWNLQEKKIPFTKFSKIQAHHGIPVEKHWSKCIKKWIQCKSSVSRQNNAKWVVKLSENELHWKTNLRPEILLFTFALGEPIT